MAVRRMDTPLDDEPDWKWYNVRFRMRARDEEMARKLTQWAFDNYFLYEDKVVHFHSQLVKDLEVFLPPQVVEEEFTIDQVRIPKGIPIASIPAWVQLVKAFWGLEYEQV
jgi:hypothetical protein